MAVHAGNFPRFMRTSFPEQSVPSFVTRKAGTVLFVDCVSRILGETDWDRFLSTSRIDVVLAGTVTGLASELFLGVFRIREGFTHNGFLKVLALVCVTDDTGFAAGVVIVCLCSRRRCRGCGGTPADHSNDYYDDNNTQRQKCMRPFHSHSGAGQPA
jgi:hypothetical protein